MPRASLLALAFTLAACSEPPPEPADHATFTPEDPTEETPAAPLSLLPAPGTVESSTDGRGADLRANEALLSEVLQSLASAQGFALDVGESRIEDRRLTARIDDAPIFDVLAVVLRGFDYELEIAFDPVSQGHRIALLRIRPSLEPEEAPEDVLGDALYTLLDAPDPSVVLAVIEALERSGDEGAIPELEPLLDDEDPDIQEAAARAIEALH